MGGSSGNMTLDWVNRRLHGLLRLPLPEPAVNPGPPVLVVGGHSFLLELREQAGVAQIAQALAAVRVVSCDALPLLVVPFMTEAGRSLCDAEGISWLDLSGNADIASGHLRILIEGKPNLFKRPGRVATAFAPKGARVSRFLLQHPGEFFSQREVANAVGSDPGHTSKVVSKLLTDGLIEKNEGGQICVANTGLLLDAWAESYQFSKHRIIKGTIAGRGGDDVVLKLSGALKERETSYAFTGLAAAWQVDSFAGFRLVTTYLRETPSEELLKELHFYEDERGANVWIVVPNDPGVFEGAAEYKGLPCVHPVQIYLDLQAQPERASEAAEHLRQSMTQWGVHGG